jgi:hypothetical protein
MSRFSNVPIETSQQSQMVAMNAALPRAASDGRQSNALTHLLHQYLYQHV